MCNEILLYFCDESSVLDNNVSGAPPPLSLCRSPRERRTFSKGDLCCRSSGNIHGV